MVTKTVDSRGRIALGPKYANHLVMVRERDDGTLEIIPAEAIPVGEAWLHKNPEALAAVRQGLQEAAEGRFAEAPDLGTDESDDDGNDG
jgi:predicted transcriptional regulator